MNWNPMDTAPEDREFLGAWGGINGKNVGYDIYRYIGNGVYESMNAEDERFPNKFYKIFGWMDIPKFDLR